MGKKSRPGNEDSAKVEGTSSPSLEGQQAHEERQGQAGSDAIQLSPLEPGSGLPLYEQVTGWLLQKVKSGEWPIHHQLPPEVLLAEQLQVSRVTMRRALGDLTKQGVFVRIAGRGTFVALTHRTVPRSTFVPHLHHADGDGYQEGAYVRRLSTSDMRLIGVIVPNTASPFGASILVHLEHALYKRGYRMLLASSHESLKLQDEHLRQYATMGVAGIVLYSGSFLHDEMVNTLLSQKMPLVMIDRYYPAITANLVTTDHYRSGYVMGEYLLRQGHRHIGFVLATTETVTSTLARFEGFKAALHDYGVNFDERMLMKAQIHPETVRAYLKRAHEMTVVFACNDDRAIEFYAALHALGLHIPDDISLVGCDDIPVVSQIYPPLTTVAQNVLQIGEAAAQLLLDTIEGRVLSPRTITIPPELVVRQSSRPPTPGQQVPPVDEDDPLSKQFQEEAQKSKALERRGKKALS